MNNKQKRLLKSNFTLEKYFKPQSQKSDHQKDHQIGQNIKIPASSGLSPFTLPLKIPLKYPKNPQIRQYQYQIVQKCTIYNTLVCLPTGLGKTHIAAILMANFTRWFPEQKIIFLAPTKPLVNQQKSALKILQQLVQKDTIVEVTGKNLNIHRQQLYKTHKIIFATPKTIENDISSQILKKEDIILLIFDQCHRSTGNSSYALIMKLMNTSQAGFRVVGLSATPGYEIQKIQEVIQNLNISNMVYKDETYPEVAKYLHHKYKEQIIVKQTQLISQSLKYLDTFAVKSLGILCQLNLIKGWIIKRGLAGISFYLIRQQFNKNIYKVENRHKNLAYMALNMVIFLSRCRRALLESGYQTFRLLFFNQVKQNLFQNEQEPHQIQNSEHYSQNRFTIDDDQVDSSSYLDDIYEFYSEPLDNKNNKSLLKSCSSLIKKCIIQTEQYKKLQNIFMNKNSQQMHPKLFHVAIILKRFFKDFKEQNRRAIVFTQYKITVMQIKQYLKQNDQIKAQYFFGQNKTKFFRQNEQQSLQLKQDDQLKIIQKFKSGQINVLISTCIGQEGLDIGQVDCIICYDGGHSPIRSIQRYGRTGRKRDGYVYILLMEGKEADQFKNGKNKAQKMKKLLKNTQKFKFYSYNSTLFEDRKYISVQQLDNRLIYEQSQKKQTKKRHKKKYIQAQNTEDEKQNNKAEKKTRKYKRKSKNSENIKEEQLFQNNQSKESFKLDLLKRSKFTIILSKYQQKMDISDNEEQKQYNQSQPIIQSKYKRQEKQKLKDDEDETLKDIIIDNDQDSLEKNQKMNQSEENEYKNEQQSLNISQVQKQAGQFISQFINSRTKQNQQSQQFDISISSNQLTAIQVIQENNQEYLTQQYLQADIKQGYQQLINDCFTDQEGNENMGNGNREQQYVDDNRNDMLNKVFEFDSQEQMQMIMTTLQNSKQNKPGAKIDYKSILQDL